MFSRGLTEWDTDLIFKKPFTLSNKLEFMFGLGTQWTFSHEGTRVGSKLAPDFMFWPTPHRKFRMVFRANLQLLVHQRA
jgi:hypothetical protein